MKNTNNCILINTKQELENILQTKDKMFILFFAPWCPFSQRFLPIFEKCTKDTAKQCYYMMIDEFPDLCKKYVVEVFPTVIFFEKGAVSKRLDGNQGIGLSEKQFRDLLYACDSNQ